MICLGIESTAHTLGVGVYDSKRGIVANALRRYSPKQGGIHPRKAAEHHADNFAAVLSEALSRAGLQLRDVDLFAYAEGPGLGACLQVGCAGAKMLALMHRKQLLGVNHCHAHIAISEFFTAARDPLAVYVSGGNTQIITHAPHGFRVLGETLDMGIGNALDAFARSAGLQSHGSEIERLAATSGRYIPLPYSVKGMDLVFSGLLTESEKQLGKYALPDLCHSLQETAFAMLCEAAERALVLERKRVLLLCGGVAQNRRLQQMLALVAAEHGARLCVAPDQYNADNGAMIAYTAAVMFKRAKRTPPQRCGVRQRYRIDEVVL